ncbi:hypothetical protein CHS0354_009560 [Potamilus streckersoni]|uniref:Protein kinase domain-containing protein n=1 Tax=Potamilus streckersoni TaxID=2493646 RepID=A0AAE0VYQ8_9BIVA|nr:hypothetical protein CHS0354_009560 [Potamilus streckersoni]
MQSNGKEKSGPLSRSENYVWNNADCIGKGATADVYMGRHKVTGEVCAIKLFNPRESRTLAISRKREIELLKNLDHRNVIKFVASEFELSTGNEVLVMPYCQGGSLHTVLEQPQYGFGFPEEEFLIFLGDIEGGIEYLRSTGIIHRDIKPGNIMRFIDDNGRSVYKLTDFGAAKQLEHDEEQFQSIYGTEEYLHPDMYQRAVLREPGQQYFDASVDLWSLGCTIYHVATGQLPFQVYGGRSNTAVMHKITSEKKSGVISAIQTEPDGNITWSTVLPNTCLLPESLKTLITPVLAGLMETNKSKAYTFEQFFDQVKSIVSRKRIEIFLPATCSYFVLYMNGNDKYSNIQEEVASQTGVMLENQLLLCRDKDLRTIVSTTDEISKYPKIILEGDICLFNVDTLVETMPYTLETVPFPQFSLACDLNEDVKLAKRSSSVAYYYEFLTEKVVRCQKRAKQSVFYLREYIRGLLNPINAWLSETKKLASESKRSLGVVETSLTLVGTMLSVFKLTPYKDSEKIAEFANKGDVANLKTGLAKEDKRIQEIDVYLQVLLERIKEQEENVTSVGCQDESYCVSTVRQYRQTIHGVLTTFGKHKRYGELHSHEVFIHKAEMHKLEESSLGLLSVFQGCLDNLKRVHGEVKKHSGLLLKHLARAKKVEVNMNCVIEFHRELDVRLGRLDATYKEAATTLSQVLERRSSETSLSKPDGNKFLVNEKPSTRDVEVTKSTVQYGATDITDEEQTSKSGPKCKEKIYCDLRKQLNETRLGTESVMKDLSENKKSLESIMLMLQKGIGNPNGIT